MIALWLLGCREPAPGPNLLVVVWDTVRADRLSAYGHDRPTTPWLASFAERGLLFEQASSPACWTLPAHASLFTGLPLTSHGVDLGYPWLDGAFPTLTENLRDAGWDTFAWTGNRFVSPATNLVQGFDQVETSWRGRGRDRARAATRAKLLPEDRSTEISPAWVPHGHGDGWSRDLTEVKDAAPVARQALAAWLRGRADPTRPFYAFVNLMEAHQPLIPSQSSRGEVMTADEQQAALVTDATVFGWMAYTSGKQEYRPHELAAMRAAYDAAIRDLDWETEALVDELATLGQLQKTVVVVVADHGELLGEHHQFSHRWALWEELLRVPLVIVGPGVTPGRVGEPVSTAQLPAALLELLGAPPLAGAAPSLLGARPPAVFAELRDPNPVMEVVRQAWPDVPADAFGARLRSARDARWKWIGSDRPPVDRLYAIGADPDESDDRALAEPTEAARLRAAYDDWRAQQPPYDPARRTPEDRPRGVAPDERDALRSLGYLDDGK